MEKEEAKTEINKYQICYSTIDCAHNSDYDHQWNYLFSSQDQQECIDVGEDTFRRNPGVAIVLFDTESGEGLRWWGYKNGS